MYYWYIDQINEVKTKAKMSPGYVMRIEFTSVVFLPKTQNPSLFMRKISAKSQLEDILQNTQLALLKTVKVIKNWESLRNSPSLEEATETGQLNVMWSPRRDPGTEKGR